MLHVMGIERTSPEVVFVLVTAGGGGAVVLEIVELGSPRLPVALLFGMI